MVQCVPCPPHINLAKSTTLVTGHWYQSKILEIGSRYWSERIKKNVYIRTINDEKECLTVLFTIATDTALSPPLILFAYNRYVPSSIVANMPKKWRMDYSESGWITSETFYEYINICYPWLRRLKFHYLCV